MRNSRLASCKGCIKSMRTGSDFGSKQLFLLEQGVYDNLPKPAIALCMLVKLTLRQLLN